jgi:CBS domain-containing protein
MKKAVFVDAEDPLSRAIGEISRSGLEVVVLKDGKYYGLIGDRDVRQHGVDVKTKCITAAEHAPHLAAEATIVDMCNAFFAGRFKALPVVSKDKVIGMVTRADVVRAILDEKLLPKKKVSEVMSSPVVTIDEKATIANAKEMMWKNNVRRLVVTRNDMLEGIISTFDLAALGTQHREGSGMSKNVGQKFHPDMSPVSSFMRQNIETVEPDDYLAEAARKMAAKEVSALIVSDGIKPLGIVTARDLFESALKAERKRDVFISGLSGEDRALYADIEKECDSMLDKLRKSFEIESMSLHVKKHGNKYSMRARVHSSAGIISVSAHEWDAFAALKLILAEIKRALMKHKANKLHHND